MIFGSAVPTTVWSSANRNIARSIAPRISSLARGERLSAASSAVADDMGSSWAVGQPNPDTDTDQISTGNSSIRRYRCVNGPPLTATQTPLTPDARSDSITHHGTNDDRS